MDTALAVSAVAPVRHAGDPARRFRDRLAQHIRAVVFARRRRAAQRRALTSHEELAALHDLQRTAERLRDEHRHSMHLARGV